ncbi:TIGR04197 family type VII secretion effector [Streptococcus oricebi]|nr:TIGR04197 family type VII secretion effector [Streptococcus oricebi]
MPDGIQSDASIASKHATAIAKSLAALSSDLPTKDTSSHLQGNESAKTTIDKQASFSGELSSKLGTFVGLIKGVHSDFQVMDEEISQDVQASGEK